MGDTAISDPQKGVSGDIKVLIVVISCACRYIYARIHNLQILRHSMLCNLYDGGSRRCVSPNRVSDHFLLFAAPVLQRILARGCFGNGHLDGDDGTGTMVDGTNSPILVKKGVVIDQVE